MGPGTRAALYVPFFVSIMLVLVPYALLSSEGTVSLASSGQALCGSLLIVLGLSTCSWTISRRLPELISLRFERLFG